MGRYQVTLETLGPVFIGSGERLRRGEYIFEKKQAHNKNMHHNRFANQKNATVPSTLIKMIDMEPFLRLLKNENLLDKYLEDKDGSFFEKHTKLKKQVPLLKDGTLAFASNDSKYTDVELFIRNGMGEKYIPGSSLKGAFRTVIESKLTKNEKAVNDIFHAISFSDSDVILNKNFKVYKKYDMKFGSKKYTQIPLYRECINPNVQVKFYMSLDESIITISQLQQYLTDFYQKYQTNWLNEFDIKKKPVLNDNRNHIYLGGGVGFVSKTLHYQKSQDIEITKKEIKKILEKEFPKIRYNIKQPVPRVVKYSKDGTGYVEFGLCALMFKRV